MHQFLFFLIFCYSLLVFLDNFINHEQQLIGNILNFFSLIICFTRLVLEFPQSMLVPIVIVVKKFILVIILERYKRPLKSVEVQQFYPREVEWCDFHWKCLQCEFNVYFILRCASYLNEHKFVQEATY